MDERIVRHPPCDLVTRMNPTPSNTRVTLIALIPDQLCAADMLLLLKYVNLMGIAVVSFDWPQPATTAIAA